MASRAVDAGAALPSHDLQVEHTLSCPFGHKDRAQAALPALAQQFQVSHQVCTRLVCCKFDPVHMQAQLRNAMAS